MRYGGNLSDFELQKWNELMSLERFHTALKIGTVIRLGLTLSAGLEGFLQQIEMVKHKKMIMIRCAPEIISISREVFIQKIENLSKHFNCSVELEPPSSQSVN